MDALSQALETIRLRAEVYFREDFEPPWGIDLEPSEFAQFHLLVRGRARLETGGLAIELETGDVVLLAPNTPHRLLSEEGVVPTNGRAILTSIQNGSHRRPRDTDPQATLICGHFAYRTAPLHPLVAALPEVLRLTPVERRERTWLESITQSLVDESARKGPGQKALTNRLAECLYIQVVRAYLAREDLPNGLLKGLCDPVLGRAIALLWSHCDRPWSVQAIASEVAMSRANFARRFSALIGTPPMEFLSRSRLHESCVRLVDTNESVTRIAGMVGFASPASFSRAICEPKNSPVL